MLLGLVAVALATLLACTAAGSAGHTSPKRVAERRDRYLRDHADHVNALDVERVLLTSLRAETAADICRRAEALGVRSPTAWKWIQVHGTPSFVLAVRAGVGAAALERHLAEGSMPDRRSLELFAQLNARPVEELVRDAGTDEPPESATRLPRRELGRFGSLPPITEPGLWPFAG
jgi:hypothetical protein